MISFTLIYDSNGKRHKVIPTNIGELLTSRSLAYWIMDDGGINAYKATQLNTDSYTLEDVNRLQCALANSFQPRTRLVEKRKDQWMIVIPVCQVVPLCDIVTPYMHPSMAYKVTVITLILFVNRNSFIYEQNIQNNTCGKVLVFPLIF